MCRLRLAGPDRRLSQWGHCKAFSVTRVPFDEPCTSCSVGAAGTRPFTITAEPSAGVGAWSCIDSGHVLECGPASLSWLLPAMLDKVTRNTCSLSEESTAVTWMLWHAKSCSLLKEIYQHSITVITQDREEAGNVTAMLTNRPWDTRKSHRNREMSLAAQLKWHSHGCKALPKKYWIRMHMPQHCMGEEGGNGSVFISHKEKNIYPKKLSQEV